MRCPLMYAILLAFSLGTIALAHGAALESAATLRPASSQASPAASPVACPDDAPPGRLVNVPNRVTIRLTDDGFDPSRIQTTNNADMAITLTNIGTRPHAFVLDDFDIRLELAPGATETLTLELVGVGDAQTFDFHSDAPGDECMHGALIFYI